MRSSVGRVAHVGDLYDARSETFCGISILKKQPPPTALRVTDENHCDIQLVHSSTFSKKCEILGITGELKLSILAGIFALEGHGKFLKDEKKSARAVRSSLVYIINTKLEHLNLTSEDLKDCLEFKALQHNQATHIVIDVHWGANATITMESMNSESKDIKEVEGELSAELNKIASNFIEVSGQATIDYKKKEKEKENSFSLHVFADVLPDGDLPQTVEEAIELMKKLPTLLQEANQGKGKPIRYMMVPISTINHVLNKTELSADRLVEQLDEEAIARFVSLFDEISVAKQQLTDLCSDMDSHKFCVLEQDIERANEARTQLNNAEAKLRSKLAATLVLVRSGKAGAEKLENIRAEFENCNSSPGKVQTVFHSFLPVINRMKLADTLIAERIIYIGRCGSLETEIVKYGQNDIYVLFFSDELIKTDKKSWTDNCSLFLTLARSAKLAKLDAEKSTKCIAVDLTMNSKPSILDEIGNGIRIVHYKNGKDISSDVFEEFEAKKSLCLAKSDKIKLCEKPNKRVCLELRCAGSRSGLCPHEDVSWSCFKCEESIYYGFDDFFYCTCGHAPATTYVFKCCSEKHGNDFVKFSESELKVLLQKHRPLKEMNILILGETGVGKSTWINGIVNYITFPTLEDAKACELRSVIPTSFTVTNENYEETKITVGEDKNECLEANGQSATQGPKTYAIELRGTLIRLIDTPGIGDTRGIDQDRKNFKHILHHISYLDELHGICILLKPNDSRINVMFRFCIKELLTHLHKSASENIVFCFTNARSTFYRPGETLPNLRTLLKESRIDIPTALSTLYCLDNEAFRFLCTLHHGIKYGPEDYKTYSASWEKAVAETDRMFDHIASLRPHPIKHTTSLNNARDIIVCLTEPMAEISRNILRNIYLVKSREREVKTSTLTKEELAKRLKIPKLVLVPVLLGYPRTVCTDTNCVKYHKENDITLTEFVTHCHEHCQLEGVLAETYPNPSLQKCAAMGPNLMCKKCGHSWNTHMHVRYASHHEMQEVINESVQNEINIQQTEVERIQGYIKELQKRVEDLEVELQSITVISAKFGKFLKNNAITPYNDALKDYLAYLIQEEKNKPDQSEADKKTLEGLEKMKLAYEHQIQILNQSMENDQDVGILNPEDIVTLEEELYQLPINGEELRQHMAVSIAGRDQMMQYCEHPYAPKCFPSENSSKGKKEGRVAKALKWIGHKTGGLIRWSLEQDGVR